MKIRILAQILSLILIFGNVPIWGAAGAPDPLAMETERNLKKDAESEAQAIVNSIFGPNRANVLVNIEVGLESTKKGGSALNRKQEGNSKLGEENYILPWVPAPKSVSKEEVPDDANVETQAAQQESVDVKTLIRRFDITVVHDEKLPDELITQARETLLVAFDRYKEVLRVIFRPASFLTREGPTPKDVVAKNLWDSLTLKNLLFLFLLFLVFYLLRFFFGPLAKFMQDYINGMKDQARSKVEMENKSETENESDQMSEEEALGGEEGELTEEELAALEPLEDEMEEKFEPFKYINDVNVKQLAYLLHHEEPWVVAMVLSYLTAEHAYKVMEALPPDLQAKVALETAMYRQTSMDQIQAIDADIKQKIDFVVGGLEKLVGILESSDRFARDNILEYLRNEKPGLYERVRERILLFEDIARFPNQAMQVIVRELKNEDLAKALRDTSPELQQKFFENMSQGAVALLKEEMEYGRPVTPDQIEEERRKIIDYVKKLEEDGKIAFRQKGFSSAISGDEIGGDASGFQLGSILNAASTPSFAEGDPEAFANAYNAGLAAQESGDMETAISYLAQAVQMDPSQSAGHQALANAYYGLGQMQDALTEYELVLQIEPSEELQQFVDQLRATLAQAA